MKEKIKSEKLLTEFVAYCVAHPGERFWQALRNWSKAEYIYFGKYVKSIDDICAEDTFYFEGKRK